jgi:hypothetical protein
VDEVRNAQIRELAAQVADVDAQSVRGWSEVVCPHTLVDQAVRQDPPRVEHQELEQLVLGPRQLNHAFAHHCTVLVGIELEVAEAETFPAEVRFGASQESADPCGQLSDVERLDQVIVRSGIESVDAILDRIACREHEDRCPVTEGAQPATKLESVHAGHHHVEDDHIRPGVVQLLEPLEPVLGSTYLLSGQYECAS